MPSANVNKTSSLGYEERFAQYEPPKMVWLPYVTPPRKQAKELEVVCQEFEISNPPWVDTEQRGNISPPQLHKSKGSKREAGKKEERPESSKNPWRTLPPQFQQNRSGTTAHHHSNGNQTGKRHRGRKIHDLPAQFKTHLLNQNISDPESTPTLPNTLCLEHPLSPAGLPLKGLDNIINPVDQTTSSSLEREPLALEIDDYELPCIPETIEKKLLPSTGISILAISEFKLYDNSRSKGKFKSTPSKINVSRKPADSLPDENLIPIIQALPLPSNQTLDTLRAHVKRTDGAEIQSFRLSSDQKTSPKLPLWVIAYWEKQQMISREKHQWNEAITQLKTESNQKLLDLLNTVPWDGCIPKRLGFRVRDLAVLATNHWLSGSHMDMLGEFFNIRFPRNRRILSVTDGQALILRHRLGEKDGKFRTPGHLRNVGADLAAGGLEQIGICFNIFVGGGFPSREERGNHWVAIVIDRNKQNISFGDSYEDPPPAELILVIKSWLWEYFSGDFAIASLEHTKQSTSWCCGDLSINMIAHRFDDNIQLVSKGSVSMQLYRRSMLVDLIDLIRKLSVDGEGFSSVQGDIDVTME